MLLQLRFGLSDKRADIPAAHIGAHHNPPLAVFPADLIRPRRQFQAGDLGQRNIVGTAFATSATRQRNRQALEGFQITPQLLGQAYYDIKAAVALKQGAGLLTAYGSGDHVLYISHVEAIARGLFPVYIHRQHGQTGGLLDLDLSGAGDLAQHGRDFICGIVQDLHVIAEYLDGDIATHAGNQFIETQLDRLRELVVVTGNFVGGFLNSRQQLWP